MQSNNRILFITPEIPDPVGIGIQRRCWAQMMALSKLGAVDFLYIGNPRSDGVVLAPELSEFVRNTWEIPCGPNPSRRNRKIPGLTLIHRLKEIRQPAQIPLQSIADDFIQLLRSIEYQLVFCFRLITFEFLDAHLGLSDHWPCVVDFDDIESKAKSREAKGIGLRHGFEFSLLYRSESARLRLSEKRALKTAAMILVCSAPDREDLKRLRPKAKILSVPNSFEKKEKLEPRAEDSFFNILFVGALFYEPNQDALRYFVSQVLPIIKSRSAKEVRFSAVGRAPPDSLQELARTEGFQLAASVPDTTPYYACADVVVVPIRFGGGTRIKILEALALGRVVVSTTIGAEGIELRPGVDLLIADTPQDMAQQCLSISNDPQRRDQIVASGHERFKERYESSTVRAFLAGEIRQLIDDHTRVPGPNLDSELGKPSHPKVG